MLLTETTTSEDVEVKQSPPRNTGENKDNDVIAAEPSPEEDEENSQLLREQEEKRKKLREERNEISRQVRMSCKLFAQAHMSVAYIWVMLRGPTRT